METELKISPEMEYLLIMNEYKILEQNIKDMIFSMNKKILFINSEYRQYKNEREIYEKILGAMELLVENKIEINGSERAKIIEKLSNLNEKYKYIVMMHKGISNSICQNLNRLIPATLNEARKCLTDYFLRWKENDWGRAVISAFLLSKISHHGMNDEYSIKLIEYFKTGDLESYSKYVVVRHLIERSIRSENFITVIYFLDSEKFYEVMTENEVK